MTEAVAREGVRVRVAGSFSGPLLDHHRWETCAAAGDTCTVFQERAWLETWWCTYGRGELAIVLVTDEAGTPVMIAPLFVDGDMAFFVGSGGSDYLDFVGGSACGGSLRLALSAVLQKFPALHGFRFYHVPDRSHTGHALAEAAIALELDLYDEGSLTAPMLDLGPGGECGIDAASRTSLMRHQRALERHGAIEILHPREMDEVLGWLDCFFEQHIRRWAQTRSPSLFVDPQHRMFYRRLASSPQFARWLRFTIVLADARPVAFHFGTLHRRAFLWYKPSFDVEQARLSPGEVLLRHLLLTAVQEGAQVFDFGIGDEAFKHRFASATPVVRTWGLYRRGIG